MRPNNKVVKKANTAVAKVHSIPFSPKGRLLVSSKVLRKLIIVIVSKSQCINFI